MHFQVSVSLNVKFIDISQCRHIDVNMNYMYIDGGEQSYRNLKQ